MRYQFLKVMLTVLVASYATTILAEEPETDTWEQSKQYGAEAWDSTKQAAGSAWDATKETADHAWETTKDASEKAWEATKEFSEDTWDKAKDLTGSEDESEGEKPAEDAPPAVNEI